MTWLATFRSAARHLKTQALVIYCVARHPRTPWWAKALALVVAAYAFSPIDLIPDFIPVLGLLDDLLLIPLGIALVIRLTPADVIAEARASAATLSRRPTSWLAAFVILALWLLAAAVFAYVALHSSRPSP